MINVSDLAKLLVLPAVSGTEHKERKKEKQTTLKEPGYITNKN